MKLPATSFYIPPIPANSYTDATSVRVVLVVEVNKLTKMAKCVSRCGKTLATDWIPFDDLSTSAAGALLKLGNHLSALVSRAPFPETAVKTEANAEFPSLKR